jgi:hypothetical protein
MVGMNSQDNEGYSPSSRPSSRSRCIKAPIVDTRSLLIAFLRKPPVDAT